MAGKKKNQKKRRLKNKTKMVCELKIRQMEKNLGRKLTEEEKKKVLEKFNVSLRQMPSILKNDPAIQSLNANAGDLIMIKRKSVTAKEAIYYRVVLNG